MALIVCKGCGRKISDTVERCVHCGEMIQIEKEDTPCGEKETVYYESLLKEQQRELELEFLNENPRAQAWMRTKGVALIFGSVWYSWFTIGFIARLVSICYAQLLNDGAFYNEELIEMSNIFSGIIFVICVAFMIMRIIMKIVSRHSVERYMYLKQFQLWLSREKKISFVPFFKKNKEKYIFENLGDDDVLDF